MPDELFDEIRTQIHCTVSNLHQKSLNVYYELYNTVEPLKHQRGITECPSRGGVCIAKSSAFSGELSDI